MHVFINVCAIHLYILHTLFRSYTALNVQKTSFPPAPQPFKTAHYSCEHKQHWHKPIFRGIVHNEYTSIHLSIRFYLCSIASRTDKIIISLAYSENIVFLKIIKFIIYMWKRNLSTMRYDQANCCVLSTSMLFVVYVGIQVGTLYGWRYIYFVKCHISLSSITYHFQTWRIPISNEGRNGYASSRIVIVVYAGRLLLYQA